ncbi:MAG: Stp1/IreP family PP2C-type Ser/Thr phosphatase [Deinococcota bacterium]
MRLEQHVGHGSDVGRVRSLNEDYHRVWQFALPDGIMTLLAVADGMGGAASGEVASKLAVEIIDQSFDRYIQALHNQQTVVGVDKLIEKSVRLANKRVYAKAMGNAGQRGMGTTLTCVSVMNNKAVLGHVGDSRAYLIRKHKIYQLTRDHSWVEEQLERGLLSEEQAQNHEWRNLITKALGIRPDVEPDIVELDVHSGDIFVIATDGLHGLVSPQEILAEIERTANRQSSVEYLIALANERGGPDNITLVIAELP